MKYIVKFSGFHYVEANSPEEALEKGMRGDEAAYSETQVEFVQEVDDFVVQMED